MGYFDYSDFNYTPYGMRNFNFLNNDSFNFNFDSCFTTPSDTTSNTELSLVERLNLKKSEEKMAEVQKPLSSSEQKILNKQLLKIEEKEHAKNEGTLLSALCFTVPFTAPTLSKAFKSNKNTINMFYNQNSNHMDLFTRNPDLMTNAQESMRKLERKFANDIKAAKGNRALMKQIVEERNFFRYTMENALRSSSQEEIARVTAQCQSANKVKNGGIRRFFRRHNNLPKINSRFDAVAQAERAGQFTSISVPKEGVSFKKNFMPNRTAFLATSVMAIIPIVLDWGNIKQAKEIDRKNRQDGKETHYARKQITQTSIKGVSSAITFSVCDAGARTIAKKCLGKIATKLAAKIALKGGCKMLGSAIGSIVPGIGTVAGLLIGTAADFVLNKYVFNNIEYFKTPAAKSAQINSATAEEMIKTVSEKYMMGEKLDSKSLNILKKKCDSEAMNEMKRVRHMSEKERNQYFVKIQEETKKENLT